MQEHDGVKHPVLYAIKTLLLREQNCSVDERKVLAIIRAVLKFHRYMIGGIREDDGHSQN